MDILAAAYKLQRFLAGMTLEEFRNHEMAQSAVIRELQVVGEAAGNISTETQMELAEIEWHAIIGLRNRLVHEYLSLRLEILWEIVQLERFLSPDIGQEES